MILLIDNYDSFTWNLVHYLRELGAKVEVVRNDALTAAEAMARGAEAIIISPGPGTPSQAGISLELVAGCAAQRRPLLGVCLGHQAIGEHFGGLVIRAPAPVHGKTSVVSHDGSGLFEGIPSPFTVARYHSLTVDAATVPASLLVSATAPDGTVQGLSHRELPIHGVQFHPESVASEHGHRLLGNFLNLAAATTASKVRGGA